MSFHKNCLEQRQGELGDNYGEVYETYLHTIGNLTLTGPGHNAELSAFTFKGETGGLRCTFILGSCS